MATVGQITGNVASAHYSAKATSPIKKNGEDEAIFGSFTTADLTEIYSETGEIGPTKKNAAKLVEHEKASNPFKKNGKLAGTQAFNAMDALENFDWTTGSFLNLTVK